MSVHMRVYPAGAAGAYGATGLGGVSVQTYYQQKLTAQQQISNLQLQYERALWGERLEKTKLEEQLKNPYLALNNGYGAYGASAGLAGLAGLAGGIGGLGAVGGMPLGGMPIGGMPGLGGLGVGAYPGAMPMGFGGGSAGQTNMTNQTATSAGTQSASSVNTNQQRTVADPYGPYATQRFRGFGGGGLLSSILGALI